VCSSDNIDPTNPNVASRWAHEVGPLPPTRQAIPIGKPGHYEIVPTQPMTMDAYRAALSQVSLTPVPPAPAPGGGGSPPAAGGGGTPATGSGP
jgi:hypothetical protein